MTLQTLAQFCREEIASGRMQILLHRDASARLFTSLLAPQGVPQGVPLNAPSARDCFYIYSAAEVLRWIHQQEKQAEMN